MVKATEWNVLDKLLEKVMQLFPQADRALAILCEGDELILRAQNARRPDLDDFSFSRTIVRRALSEGVWSLETRNIRDFAADKHRSVDDTPAGGGAGMVLRPDVLAAALDSVADGRPMLALTPRGMPLTQARRWT